MKVFATVFVNAFSLCMRNIARRLDQTPRSKDFKQQILILVRYDADAAKSKYAAGSVCLMQVLFTMSRLSDQLLISLL